MHGNLVRQLTKFQLKGDNLPHMSSAAAWQNLHSQCALEWWAMWGQEVPELQHLAMKLVPLLISSGPAERVWKDVDNVLTKKRNRLAMTTCLDLVFARCWLRRELTTVSDVELEVFQEWETEMLRQASFYDGVVELAEDGRGTRHRILEDHIEDWEAKAIDGTGPGERMLLGDVKTNKAAKFRLQEKYQGLYFVDKDPDGDTAYYDDDPDSDADTAPLSPDKWENRKIIGLIWENRNGWRLETKLCDSLTGTSANYVINPCLIRMIKESTHNKSVQFRSDM